MNINGLLLAAAGAVLASGCSSKPNAGLANTAGAPASLTEARDLIRGGGPNGRPATKLSDLDRARTLFPSGYKAIKDNEIVVLWGTPLKKGSDVEQGVAEDVLAYEKNVPKEGGYVLFSGGTIKKMTAPEFAAAPKVVKPGP
jgi:hypothetical protein